MKPNSTSLIQCLRKMAAPPACADVSDPQLLEHFLTQHSEAAFAALVRRHGPMVLNVCRRVLHHDQDAEDAFQATFLVLARKAGSIRKHESVGSWLHGVAYRVSRMCKSKEARRLVCQRQMPLPQSTEAPDDIHWYELRSLLDEELGKLPEKYRSPLMLCYLEGRTRDEAAQQLGVSKAVFRRRLEYGRDRLGRQLARRGVTLSAALSAPLLLDAAAQAALPPLLAANTVRAGLAAAMGDTVSGMVSAQAAALAESGAMSLLAKKASIALAVLVALTLSIGVVLAHRAVHNQTFVEAPVPPPPLPARSASKEQAIEIAGRVLGPDGKPFTGARLFLRSDITSKKADLPIRATTDKDGRFRLTAQSTDFDPQGRDILAAAAKGLGLDWIEIPAESKDNITLRLVKDDVPIEGRVLDLEGRPVSGVRVHVVSLVRGDLNAWIKIVTEYTTRIHDGMSSEILGGSAFAVTGKDGRFQLTGIGRERGVMLTLRSPDIEGARLFAVTRRGPARGWRSGQDGMYAAVFDWVAAPCKPLIGTVRDKATGKPVVGLHVSCFNAPGATAVTDRQGRYRINGIGKHDNYYVGVWGVPYLDSNREDIADTPGLEPLVVHFEVQRGIAVTGRLIDKKTRKPVQAWVQYLALSDNPNRKNFTLIHGQFTSYNNVVGQTNRDGRFQVAALPGPGLLHVRPDDADGYHEAEVRIDPSQSDRKSTTCDILLEPKRAGRK